MTTAPMGAGTPVSFDGVLLRQATFDDLDKEMVVSAAGKNFNVNLEVAAGQLQDPQHAFVRLAVTIMPAKDADLLGTLRVVMDGLFSIPKTGDPAELMSFCEASGPSLLMPYVRQAITNLTAFTRSGVIVLPPINLTKLMQDRGVQIAGPPRV